MRISWRAAGVALLLAGSGGAANACLMDRPLNLDDIKYADAVVIGTMKDYRLVPNRYYARFQFLPNHVLKGEVGQEFGVAWANSTFGEPKTMPSGAYLIALKKPHPQLPPLRGASATFLPNPEPDLYTVLQAPCADAFMFKLDSKEAELVKQKLTVSRP
ncbi:MAG TPA: hypothetical protein VE079_11260 [Ensifer sp.]|nr:hypothetical protein [Ensifer sp.]